MDSQTAAAPAQTSAFADLATVITLSLFVYVVGDVLHELVAHGGVCVALGGRAIAFDTVHMDCDLDSAWGMRAVAAAGTLANLLAGFIALWVSERRRTRTLGGYLLWLFAIHEIFVGSGYLLASPLGHFGDWNLFVGGLSFEWGWRIGLTVVGVSIYAWTVRFAGRGLSRFLPADPVQRKARARALTLTPYLAGGLLLLMGGLLNQVGWQLIFISAIAAGFCGPIGFLFVPKSVRPAQPGEAEVLGAWPARPWLSAAGLALVIGFAILARGVPLS